MDCQYCNSTFSSKSALRYHQKTAKYCLGTRTDATPEEYTCTLCGKGFTLRDTYNRHNVSCTQSNLGLRLQDSLQKQSALEVVNEAQSTQLVQAQSRIQELEARLDSLAHEAISAYSEEVHSNVDRKQRIAYLEDKYLKKQPRTQYPDQNVIYILTTDRLRKDRVYILGKATNLTNRLSTYNKTDDHEVVYHHTVPDKGNLGIVETMVFSKLGEYREKANRERFILPEDKTVDLFIDTVKQCATFL